MLNNLAKGIMKCYRAILAVSLVVFLAAAFISQNIGMDSKMEGMLPDNSESLKAVSEYDRYFKSQDNVMVVVQGEDSQSFMDALEEKLTREKTANNILYKVDMEPLEDYLHLYLDTEKYRELEQQLKDKSSELARFLKSKDISSFSQLFIARFEKSNVENQEKLLDELTKLLTPNTALTQEEKEHFFSTLLFGEISDKKQSEYLVSDSQKTYLMMIKPNIDMQDFVKSRSGFFSALQQAIDDVKAIGSYRVEAGITGGALVQDNEADNTMFNGFFSTALLTFVIIILYIVLSFRKILLPLAAGYPLVLGAILATTFAYAAYKNLNMFSISFAVLLLGLGIDFAVHIISRYLEERAQGYDAKAAVANTMNETSTSMIVGTVTTAVAFLTFLTAKFKAFTQMGVISGVGILILCMTMLIVMPALILLLDSKKTSNKPLKDSEYKFLRPLGRMVEKRPYVFLVVIVILAIAVSGNVIKTNIKTDMSKIYPQNMECLKWLKIVEQEFGYNPTTLLFMADNMEELEQSVEKLSARGDVKKVESILTYLPEQQDYKLNVMKELNRAMKQKGAIQQNINPTSIITAIANINDRVQKSGISRDTESYKKLVVMEEALQGPNSKAALTGLYSSLKQLGYSDSDGLFLSERRMTIDQLPENIKSNFIGREGKFSVEVVPKSNIWHSDSFNSLKEAIVLASGSVPVGMPALMHEVTSYVKGDILRISMLCFIALFVILWVMFKKVLDAVIAILPLLFTIYITLGIIPVLGVDLNIFSVTAMPILIGIGIDSGVHLLHRIKSSADKDIGYILSHTGKAIMMTTITTLIGFGSLYFVNHPGLASFGMVTVVGMGLCLLITLIMVPALYLTVYRRGR